MKRLRTWFGLLLFLAGSTVSAAPGAPPGSSWLAEAQRDLAQREYRASAIEIGLQAPNRAQGFRTYFGGEGIRVVARSVASEPLATVTLAGVGRERDGVAPDYSALGRAEVTPDAARVSLQWPGIRADYDNQPDGLHQAIVVAHRPSGAGQLAVALDVSGAPLEVDSEGAALTHASRTLRLDAIAASDARGLALPLTLASKAGRLALVIDDRHATYPITVKTLLTTLADARLELTQDAAHLGNSVAGAGDVNGDGFADVIVGANQYDSGHPDEGAAFVYFGGAGAFNLIPDAQLESNQASAFFGNSVAGAGDVNGDGYADVIVGADGYNNGESFEGAAFVYFGGAGAFNLTADAHLESNQASAFFGGSVAGAGDVNGDGYADVIVGAQRYDNGETDEGAAFVYLGGTGAFNLTADAQLESNQAFALLGFKVAGAGDVNSDGFADVIVGASAYDNVENLEGAAFIYFGGAGVFNLVHDAQLESNQIGARMGSVAGAGDVNGDGFADVIVGAHLYDGGQTDEGAAFVYFGGAAAFNLTPDAQLESNQAIAHFGLSVAGAGDVNGDGFADVIVGAAFYDNGQTDEGAAFVYFGGAGPFNASADASLEPNQASALFGASVAGAGDVNGDGFADVIVGAFFFDIGLTDDDEGAAFVYFGGAGAFDVVADAQPESNQAGALLGISVAGSGDVNGDGYADVIVGAALYDNGETDEGAAFVYFGGAGVFDLTPDAQLESNQGDARFGISVAGAGDVNGDGTADVIVGAALYDNGETDEGAAFVYFGRAGAFDLMPDARLEPSQASTFFGVSVAGAGDVNGDGYSDVIVGAANYDNGASNEGAAFVYFGGAGDFNLMPDARLEADQADAQLGISVAGAGDVNGDSFADVIVGANVYDNGETSEGAAFIYFGGAGAFNQVHDARLESNQPGALLGASVAGAGDVNGDGYADVIVGAYLYDNGEADEGAAFVYFGGAGAFNVSADAHLQPNQTNAYFGSGVAGAGDVNGDGYADVIVGAERYDNGETDEGAAFVYYGGAGTFNLVHDARLESNQAGSSQGFRVAGAGDVNGDGFADVLVGAVLYSNGQTDEGAAFVYFGTAKGRPVLAGQYRGGGAVPVQAFGLSHQADGFVVALEATSPRGRERARLQLEACPPGAPFGALLCTRFTATSWTALTDATGTTLALTATGLDLNRVYHWRARLQYAAHSMIQPGIVSPPNPAAGPWRRLQANADVADIRTSASLDPEIFQDGFE